MSWWEKPAVTDIIGIEPRKRNRYKLYANFAPQTPDLVIETTYAEENFKEFLLQVRK